MATRALEISIAGWARIGTWVGVLAIIAAVILGNALEQTQYRYIIPAVVIVIGTLVAAISLYIRQGFLQAQNVLLDDTIEASADLFDALAAESDRIKTVLLMEFDRLIEEYRKTEGQGDRSNVIDFFGYQTDYADISKIASQKKCSPQVVAAALTSLAKQYENVSVLDHPRSRATQDDLGGSFV